MTTNECSYYNKITRWEQIFGRGNVNALFVGKVLISNYSNDHHVHDGLFLIFNISEDEGTYITITIKEGDSLWSISEQYAEQVVG